MMSTRRLTLSLLCAASCAAGPVLAFPAGAVDLPGTYVSCGQSAQDYSGTFSGTFDQAPGDTISVTFTAPDKVTTSWHVEGWTGSGQGTYELISGGLRWDDADSVSGPLSGVDSETYVSQDVSCAAGTSEAESLRGTVGSGTQHFSFSVTRRS